jgi:hypothetical protein
MINAPEVTFVALLSAAFALFSPLVFSVAAGVGVPLLTLTSQSDPLYPELQTQDWPLQYPLPLHTDDCLILFQNRLAGDALFGPEMSTFAQVADVGAGVVDDGTTHAHASSG